eukprot:3873916-Amphidinium_carterae.1
MARQRSVATPTVAKATRGCESLERHVSTLLGWCLAHDEKQYRMHYTKENLRIYVCNPAKYDTCNDGMV